jgi:endoribonuclease LACTB2
VADPINKQSPTPSIEQTYAEVRAALERDRGLYGPAREDTQGLVAVASQLRKLALRTPTLPPAEHTNAYLLGPSDGRAPLVLVDPGTPYPEEQQRLDLVLEAERAAGRQLTAVWLTHHHGDHVGGATHLAARWNVPICAHPVTARLLAPRVKVTEALVPGRTRVGELEVELLHTPGHAEGHLCFAVPSSGATLVGDMVAGLGTILIDPDEGDMAAYLDSLRLLEASSPGALLPAHGPTIPDGVGKLRSYQSHRLMREQKIADVLAAHPGATAQALVPHAYADTPPLFWPLAVRSTLAHLKKLAAERRAACDDEHRWTALTA